MKNELPRTLLIKGTTPGLDLLEQAKHAHGFHVDVLSGNNLATFPSGQYAHAVIDLTACPTSTDPTSVGMLEGIVRTVARRGTTIHFLGADRVHPLYNRVMHTAARTLQPREYVQLTVSANKSENSYS